MCKCHILFFIPLLMNIWVVSIFWFLIVLLWIFKCKFLCEHLFSVLLGTDLGVELPGHMAIQYLTSLRNHQTFSVEAMPFTFLLAMFEDYTFSTSSFHFFEYSYSSQFEYHVIWFWFTFPFWLMILSITSYAY